MPRIRDYLKPWKGSVGRPDLIKFVPRGFRDLVWCNNSREFSIPYYIEAKPHCPLCENFKAETHEFICSIVTPWQGE